MADSDEKCSDTTTSQEDKENDAEVFSLQEILESEKKQNEIATAVLGASDEINCSYDTGYVFRQALYCCKTCLNKAASTSSDGTASAAAAAEAKMDESNYHGICLACSYECHANHELYELYTKRHFRCDCGNEKFSKSGTVCKLKPQKDELNSENKYNHNFVGLYCTCNRPYPELDTTDTTTEENTATSPTSAAASDAPKPAANSDEEMSQCTICEDWFHLDHLIGHEMFKTDEDDYADMICHLCMAQNDFLWAYVGQMALKLDNQQQQQDIDELAVVNVEDQEGESKQDALDKQTRSQTCSLERLRKLQQPARPARPEGGCCCFFLNKWREALCKCASCMQMYEDKSIGYLCNENDTLDYYEECGKSKTNDIDENKLLSDELSKLNRTSQVEFLHNYNDFKQDLTDFLLDFARDGKVVKRENVEEFFDALRQRKKRKLDDDQNQMASNYYCK